MPSYLIQSFLADLFGTLRLTPAQGQCGLSSNGNERVYNATPAPELEPHHQM